ncbi:MAG: hypothetical protein JNL38_12980 [Myxococcales bacterium]|nr:hypothetical protein [Myxococcales bacterium]
MSPPIRSLAADRRGAVLLMAVFMACFLAGCLWFLIGIGDALAFREEAQASADAVAFSAAAVHARAMNLVCMLNLVLVAIVAVFLVLRYVLLLLRAVLKVTGFPDAALVSDELDTAERLNTCHARVAKEVCDVARGVWSAHETIRTTALPKYHDKVMKDGVPGISTAEAVISAVAPAVAETAAIALAAEHDHLGLALSPALLPDEPWIRTMVEEPDRDHDDATKDEKKVIGLPLAPQKIGEVCARETDWAFDKSKAWLGPVWEIFGPSHVETKAKWCGPKDFDGWFTKTDGPHRVFSRAHNGSEWTQVYGLVIASHDERATRRVALADGHAAKTPKPGLRRKKLTLPAAAEPPRVYVAQAEIYYDCEEEWHAASCNGGRFGSMYAMRWRARLVRARGPGILRRLGAATPGQIVGEIEKIAVSDQSTDEKKAALVRSLAVPLVSRIVKKLLEDVNLLPKEVDEAGRWFH